MSSFFKKSNASSDRSDDLRPRLRNRTSVLTATGFWGLALVGAIGVGFGASPTSNGFLPTASVGVKQAAAQDVAPEGENSVVTEGASASTPEAAASSEEGVEPFVDHARQAGATSCSTLLPTLGAMLTTGANYTVQSDWTEGAGNTRPLRSIVGLDYQTESYNGPAAGFVMVDPEEGGCDGAMLRVVPFQKSCEEAAALLPGNSQSLPALSGIQSFALGDGGSALMIPDEDRCVVVSLATARYQSETEN